MIRPPNVPPPTPPFMRGPKPNNRMPIMPHNHVINNVSIPKCETKEKAPEEDIFLLGMSF